MSQPMIEVKGLGKRYQLGQIGVRSLLSEWATVWRRRHGKSGIAADPREFWALRDVSFSVQPGEIVGLIGRNGAGKSTLLKILSRITEPTTGEAMLYGRIASLLEVGTGFHPDLSGRENIYLNGTMLGMSRAEVTAKLDEIIAFSELDRFIDTPVKRYSSGMYVRLAFAVAAHLEPEILVVDEVLAVGDAGFQRKCIGKMSDVASHSGRTVLFVSHNMGAIESLCQRVIMMDRGRIQREGSDVHDIIRAYLSQSGTGSQASEWRNPGGEYENPFVRIDRFFLTDRNGAPVLGPVGKLDGVQVRIEGEVKRPQGGLQLGYGIFSNDSNLLWWSTNLDGPESMMPELPAGPFTLVSEIPGHFLNEGEFFLDLFVSIYRREWICEPGVVAPRIQLIIEGGLGGYPCWTVTRPGSLGPIFPWRRI